LTQVKVRRQKRSNNLDLRDLICRGIGSFSKIRRRVDAPEPDEGLSVIAPFWPSPLVEKTGGKGFAAWVKRGTGTDWMVYFWLLPA
jgi:hypothetical protein